MDPNGASVAVLLLVLLALCVSVRIRERRRGQLDTSGLRSAADSALSGVALFFLLVRPFVVEVVGIPGDGRSMRPGFHERDRIVANKVETRYCTPRRGDVVIFRAPPAATDLRPGQKRLIKRVIGLPGDRIRADVDGRLMINGSLLVEPYVAEPMRYLPFPGPNHNSLALNVQGGEVVVPEGALFVLGDNRNASYDSTQWGFLPLDLVEGKASAVLWPPQRARILKRGLAGLSP